MINKGHQQLTIVSGRGGPERVRLAGYEAAMAINNLNPKVQLVDKFDEISGYSASKIILNKPNRPTAIIAANDLMAIGAMRASKEEGLSIPKDIAVAVLHPGLVSTRMTGFTSNGIRPEESVKGLIERIDELTIATTGTFWHSNGEVLPW